MNVGAEPYELLTRYITYIDLTVVLSCAVFLVLAIILIRLERHIFKLMTPQVPEGAEDAHVVSRTMDDNSISSATMSSMESTEWDTFSWDEKMAIQRRQQLINRVATVSGGLGVLAGMLKWKADQYGVQGYIGLFEVTLIAVAFLGMGVYWMWNHVQLKRDSISTAELQMEGTSRDRRFDRIIVIAVLIIVFGAFLGRIGFFVYLAVLAALAALLLRLI